MRGLLLVLVMLPGAVFAGPWLRDEGAGFLSFSSTIEEAKEPGAADTFTTLYGEYGLRPKLTLGVDMGVDELGFYKAIAFAVMPVTQLSSERKISLEFGVGTTDGAPVMRPGFAIGHGVSFNGMSGWMSFETRAEIQIWDADLAISTDVTFGLNATKQTKWIFQLQQGGAMSDPDYLRFAPSVVVQTGNGRHLELGMTAGVQNASAVGLKIGLWHEF